MTENVLKRIVIARRLSFLTNKNMDSQHTHGSEKEGHAHHNNRAKNSTLMAILSYLGPLVIVSYVTAKDNAFVKFHIKQGLVVFSIEVGMWILGMIIWPLMIILGIINIAAFVLSIIGIMNVLNGKETPLPLVGQYSRYFTF